MILDDLKEKFLTAESLRYVDEWVLKELARTIELASVQGKGRLAHAQLIQMGSIMLRILASKLLFL